MGSQADHQYCGKYRIQQMVYTYIPMSLQQIAQEAIITRREASGLSPTTQDGYRSKPQAVHRNRGTCEAGPLVVSKRMNSTFPWVGLLKQRTRYRETVSKRQHAVLLSLQWLLLESITVRLIISSETQQEIESAMYEYLKGDTTGQGKPGLQ